jgi:hypothetical protein
MTDISPKRDEPLGQQAPRMAWDRLHAVLPCIVAIPVGMAVLAALVDIVTTSDPHLGFAQTVAADARAVAMGRSLYADPSEQFTGMLYAPLFPVLAAPAYLLTRWDGSIALLGVAAGVGLGVLVGVVAGGGGGRRRGVAIAGGVGVGGVAWWMVSATPRHMLLEGRPDHLAWLFAFGAFFALASGVARREQRVWPPVLLFTLALWTKQTTVGAPAAAVVVMTWWAATGLVPWRQWRRLVGALAGVNVALAGCVMLATDGWARYFMLTMPSRHHRDPAIAPYAAELVRLLVVPTLVTAIAGVVLLRGQIRWERRSFAALLAVLLLVFLVVAIEPALLGRRKQGGRPNQYVGMMWACGFLLAVLHREAHRAHRALAAGVAAYGLVLALLLVGPLRSALTDQGVPVADLIVRQGRPEPLPSEILEYVQDGHSVYLPQHGALGVDEVWPLRGHLVDLLMAGETPTFFVEALRERRFDAVGLFENTSVPGLQQMNALIREGYAVGASGAPAPLLGRRPPNGESGSRTTTRPAAPAALAVPPELRDVAGIVDEPQRAIGHVDTRLGRARPARSRTPRAAWRRSESWLAWDP